MFESTSAAYMTAGTPAPSTNLDPDEIDLRKLAATLWRQRKTIVVIGVAGGALGLAVSLASTKHVSSGLFQTPRAYEKTAEPVDKDKVETISVANYKRYENTVLNPRNLQQFLEQRNQPDEPGAAEIGALARSTNQLRSAITPEFSLTEKEQRSFGIKLSSDDANALLGFRVRHEAGAPTNGAVLALLGEYIRDSVMQLDLRDYMENQCKRHQSREVELRNEHLKAKFFIEQEEARMQSLQRLIAQNPNAAAVDSRQVISLEGNGARFLSPRAHLNASEIAVADARLEQNKRERDVVASAIKKAYYCEALKPLENLVPARQFLERLLPLQTAALANQDKTRDIVEQTANELTLELDNWRDSYLRVMRFVAAPETLEVKERKPSLFLGLLGGGMLGGFFGIAFALLLSWWRNNRDGILVNES